LGKKTLFDNVLSGEEGSQGEVGRLGLYVDIPTLLCDHNLYPDEVLKISMTEGTYSGNKRLGLEGKGAYDSYVATK
jgi:hypothetical protein